MTVLVTGSREWVNRRAMRRELAKLPAGKTLLIHGACRGADRMAGDLADDLGFEVWVPDTPTDTAGLTPSSAGEDCDMLECDDPLPPEPVGWETPEKGLMRAIFFDGVHRALNGQIVDQEWVLDTESTHLCSFLTLCELFGFDALTLRRVLQERWPNLEKKSRMGLLHSHRAGSRAKVVRSPKWDG